MAANNIPNGVIEARQGRIITQIITRPTTTIITYVTLGNGPVDPTAAAAAPPPPPPPEPSPTDTTVVEPTSSSPGLSSAQIGAILGAVFGAIVILLIACYCVSLQRRLRRQREREYILTMRETMTVSDSFISIDESQDSWRRKIPTQPLVPPPAVFPPTDRYGRVYHTPQPQIRNVRRFP
ncbi:hypothetical protein B0T17DRAFT_241240 [Bombardia bombarda]|uniref:Uncharacterized protein n=1 Tax=Bombardia bombarda TaxID=252184 RepID=A0AA40CB59_9PEZI|nr:hypothetical protein B0T17DRAFT_241240 [Bombardia bombarda]